MVTFKSETAYWLPHFLSTTQGGEVLIIQSFYATRTYKLILEFKEETRLLDIQKLIKVDNLLIEEVCDNIDLFLSARIDESNEKLYWNNGLRITFDVLYEASTDLEELLNPRRKKFVKPLKTTLFTAEPKIVKENAAMLEKIKSLRYK